MDPSKMDLNLLTVFVQLYEDRKVSLAAENLGLSQPAVSSALGRLRRMLGDEVFLRTARGMQPTPLADQLVVPIANALTAIRESLFQPLLFDAATSCRQFTFAMTDIGEFHFLPQLMEKLETLAPGVTISTVRSTTINLKFEMENGKVDLALGHLPDLTTGFHCRTLFSQRYVCLFPSWTCDRPRNAFRRGLRCSRACRSYFSRNGSWSRGRIHAAGWHTSPDPASRATLCSARRYSRIIGFDCDSTVRPLQFAASNISICAARLIPSICR